LEEINGLGDGIEKRSYTILVVGVRCQRPEVGFDFFTVVTGCSCPLGVAWYPGPSSGYCGGAAEVLLLLGDNDLQALVSCSKCGGESGSSGSNHQYIAGVGGGVR